MSKRQNIFEIMNSQNDPLIEISRIDELLNDKYGVYTRDDNFLSISSLGEPTSIIKYIDENLFRIWKQRSTCINCYDFKRTLGLQEATDDEKQNATYILNYCEYVANLIYLLKIHIKKNDTLGDNVKATEENVSLFLTRYNFELKYFKEKEKVLVIAVNPQATAVAEILEEQHAYSVVEYNHFLLKGDISKKKEILKSLGDYLEPKREEIKSLNGELSKNIFFMLNNFNIRHNNCSNKDDSNYREIVTKMRKKQLEEWYDELYQMILLAFLLLENVERSKKINELKKSFKKVQTNEQTNNANT